MKDQPGWSEIFVDALKELGLPALTADDITVASDYSGDEGTGWWTAGFLILNGLPDAPGIIQLLDFARANPNPPSYKEIRNAADLDAARQLLESIDSLFGHVVVFGSKSKMSDLTFGNGSSEKLQEKKVFKHNWKGPALDRMSRICHVLARYLQVHISPASTIHWVTDEDPICDTPERRADLISTINSLRRHYSDGKPADVLVASSRDNRMDTPNGRVLCAVPDLLAGYFNEKLTAADWTAVAQRGATNGISIAPARRKERYETIDRWFAKESGLMKKSQFVLDEDAQGLRLTRFHNTHNPSS